MDRTKLLTITVLGLLIINIGTLSFLFFSSRSNHGGGHGPNHVMMEGPKKIISERLNFDGHQQELFEKIVLEHKEQMHTLSTKARHLHDELFGLLKSENFNANLKDSLLNEISVNQKNLDNLNFDHFQKIKSICKPQQLSAYNELIEELGHLFKREGPPNGGRHD